MQDKIHSLIARYFNGNLSETENEELFNLLESNVSDRKLFDDYQILWEHSGHPTAQGPIDVEGALVKTKRRMIFRKTGVIQFFQRAAAVLILAVLLSTGYIGIFQSGKPKDLFNSQVINQEISATYGSLTKFQLSDGTKVYLNAGSKLFFPNEFRGNTRNVSLVGEAFFEVTHDASKPFVVRTSGINVKVLGTAFNLQAYPGSNEISATLVHGKVILENESDGKINQLAELKPSDRAVFMINEKKIKITAEEDLDRFVAWKDGKLVFYNDPIDEVAEKIGYWYNVSVKINNSDLKRYRFTATFSDEPIEQVLDLLSKSSPIKYQIRKSVMMPDNSYSKREIVFN